MRIIAGRLKGMALSSKVASSTRPTSDAVRETIFNLLQTRYELVGAKIADLYAGTGALGLECISRGAIHCDFVDIDKHARKTINENIEKATFRCEKSAFTHTVSKVSVDAFIKDKSNHNIYDIVFADPPYADDVNIDLLNLVKPQGLLVYETSSSKLEQVKTAIEKESQVAEIETLRKIGKTGVVVVRVA